MAASDPAGVLAEYNSLRAEIDTRAKFQQQILALQITLTSAIFSFGLARSSMLGILLVVPLTTYMLCGRYVGQRAAIQWASRYISDELSPRIEGGLGWSGYTRSNPRPDRVIDWFLPMLICFPGAGAIALAGTARLVFAYGKDWPTITGWITVWLVGALATAASLYLLARIAGDRG